MARAFTASSSVYLNRTSALLSAVPISIAAWVRPAFANVQYAVANFSSTSGTNEFRLEISSSGKIAAVSVQSGTSASAPTTPSVTANVWNHAAAVFRSSTSRDAYLNGTNKGSNTTSSTPGSLNRTTIGGLDRGSGILIPFSGRIAEVAFWNIALTDDEIVALSRGIRPNQIRPDNLVGYYPIWGDHSPEIDLTSNARNLTVNGSPAKADHAPLAPFLGGLWGSYPEDVAAGGGGTTGSGSPTNANDASTASGTTTVVGASAASNVGDTSTASGTTTVTGTSDTTNANDASAASGSVGSSITGSGSPTNSDDAAAASGTTTILGTASPTNARDTASSSGTTTIVGTSDSTNGADTAIAAGSPVLVGASATTNASDTVSASGVAGAPTGTAAIVNGSDTAQAQGTTPESQTAGGWDFLRNLGAKPTRKRDEGEPEAQEEPQQPVSAPVAPKAQARRAKALAAQVKAMEASVRALEAEALALREAQEQARVRTEIERLTQAIESQNFLLAQAEAEAIEDDNAAMSLILGMVL